MVRKPGDAAVWGYALETLGRMLLSLALLFFPDLPVYYVFPLVCTASLLTSIVVSLVTQPADQDVLICFYRSVRPFGLWKPIREQSRLSPEELTVKSESVSLTILNVVLAMLAITGLYLFPMYLVGHWYLNSMIWLGLALVTMVVLRYTWYNNLPDPGPEAGPA